MKPPTISDVISDCFKQTNDREQAASLAIDLIYKDSALYKLVCDDLLNAAVRDLVNKECANYRAAAWLQTQRDRAAELSGFRALRQGRYDNQWLSAQRTPYKEQSMNNQVSSAGQRRAENQSSNAGALLSRGDVHPSPENQMRSDNTAPLFDGRAMSYMSPEHALPAHHPLTVDGQFPVDSQVTTAAAPLQELVGHGKVFNQRNHANGFTPSLNAGQIENANHGALSSVQPLSGEGHQRTVTQQRRADSTQLGGCQHV